MTTTTERQVEQPTAKNTRPFTAGVIAVAAMIALLVIGLLVLDLDRLTVGVITIALMIALMLVKVPVGLSMALPGLLGIYVLVGERALGGTLKEVAYTSFASWSFSVIPMFVLMGVALSKSGLMLRAFDVARRWLGWLPGGLAVSTNFAGAGLAATSGSSIGISYAIGRVAIPEMIKEKYPPSMATGSVAAAGSLGQVIPPSILLVIYAGVAETSVGQQLLAGIVPGVILAALFTVVIVVWALIAKVGTRGADRYTWRERLVSLRDLIPIAIVITVVLGGIYLGVFTATEAGAFGAFITILLGIGAVTVTALRGRSRGGATAPGVGNSLRTFFSSTLLETVAAVAAIFMLLVGVLLLTRVLALSGLAQQFADVIIGMGLDRIGFLMMLIPLYLLLGIFLESLPMMLLTLPILMGPLQALDINLIWFGVFFIIIAEIDLIAPPLGILNFIVHGIARQSTKGMGVDIKITDVFKGSAPFIGAAIVLIVLLILLPDVATWLPDLSVGN